MKKSHPLGVVCACILSMAPINSRAAIITYGNLTTDDTANYITDTVTGRNYTRFDAFNLTYEDTVAATLPGGAWEGWTIADSTIADDFTTALFEAATPCASPADPYGTGCGTLAGWADGVFGATWDASIDYFFFLSTEPTPNKTPNPVGVTAFNPGGLVQDYDDWGTVAQANNSAGSDPQGLQVANFLLYQDAAVVPVPAAIWLFGAGLLGLIGVARRKVRV